jgi:tetratricopeptide (TPR) repeat protein
MPLILAGLLGLAGLLWTAPQRRQSYLQKAPRAALEAEVKNAPQDVDALYHLGRRYLEENNPQAALAPLRRAVGLTVRPEVWEVTAEAIENVEGAAEALTFLEGFVKQNPQSAEGHRALGRLAQRQRLWNRAYDAAKKATELAPKDALSWHLLGRACASSERTQEAEQAYQKAFDVNPNLGETQTGMGEIKMQQKQYTEAATYFRAAIRIDGEQPIPHLYLGQTLLKGKTTPETLAEAQKSLEKCKELRPDITLVYFILGQCYAAQGKWEEARTHLEKAQEVKPEEMGIYFELGKVYEKLGQKEASARAYERHKRLALFNDERRVLQARLEQCKDRKEAMRLHQTLAEKLSANLFYTDAREHYQFLLKNQEESPQIWEGFGTTLAAQGQTNEALAAFLRAVKADSKRPWAQMALAEVYNGLGFREEALRRLQVALQSPETRPEATQMRTVIEKMSPQTAVQQEVDGNLAGAYAQSWRAYLKTKEAKRGEDCLRLETRLLQSGGGIPVALLKALVEAIP